MRSKAPPELRTPHGTRLGRIVTGVPTGNLLASGEDGSVLFIAANHQLLRVETRTRGSRWPANRFSCAQELC